MRNFVAGLVLGIAIGLFLPDAFHREEPVPTIVAVVDSIRTLQDKVERIEESLSRFPVPPPGPPPKRVDTVKVTVTRAQLDSLAFYRVNYPILYGRVSLLEEEIGILKRQVRQQSLMITSLRLEGERLRRQLRKERLQSKIIKAGILFAAAVVVVKRI